MEAAATDIVGDEAVPVVPRQWLGRRTLTGGERAVWIALVVLALLPSLYFPFGPSTAELIDGSQKLFAGGYFYRGSGILAPSPLRYLFGAAISPVDDPTAAVRLLDLLLQLATCWFISILVRRTSGNELWGALSALVYAVHYLSLGPTATTLPESYLGLFALPMLLLLERGGLGGSLAAGALGGQLFLLKPSLAMVVLVVAIPLVDRQPDMVLRWKTLGVFLLGFALMAVVSPIHALLSDAPHSSGLPGNDIGGKIGAWSGSPNMSVRMLIESPVVYFGSQFTMTMSILVSAGMILGLRRDRYLSPNTARLVLIVVVAAVLLLISVVVEGHYAEYMFSRIYPFTSIVAALGLLFIAHLLRQSAGNWFYRFIIIVGLASFAILFSPLPRYVGHIYNSISERGSHAPEGSGESGATGTREGTK